MFNSASVGFVIDLFMRISIFGLEVLFSFFVVFVIDLYTRTYVYLSEVLGFVLRGFMFLA